jgi:hypothetical protein
MPRGTRDSTRRQKDLPIIYDGAVERYAYDMESVEIYFDLDTSFPSSLSMPSYVRLPTLMGLIDSIIASRQSLGVFSFYNLDTAQEGSDLERLEIVADHAYCRSGGHKGFDQV